MITLLKRIVTAISSWLSALSQWWADQPWPMRLYSAGGMVILGAIAFALIGLTYRGVHETLLLLGAMLLAAGIVLEGYRLAERGWATRPGKFIGALVATMIGALSMGIASVVVNQATGLPPGEFPYTVTFLAPLTAGYIILLLTLLAFFVASLLIVAAGLVSIWKTWNHAKRRFEGEFILMMTRLVASIILFVLVSGAWEKQHRPYEDWLVSVASWFAYNFEMYGNDACARSREERVHRIDSDVALVGHEHGNVRMFSARRCLFRFE